MIAFRLKLLVLNGIYHYLFLFLSIYFDYFRGIGIYRKSDECLRTELNTWLETIASGNVHVQRIDKDRCKVTPINEQNKRFTMMALNIAKDFVRREDSKCYRSLFREPLLPEKKHA